VRRLGGFDEIAIDCRIIASASPMLEQVVTKGEFREDLYYRLNVFSITLPSLRERPEDIEAIARHFLTQESREHRRPKGFAPDAYAALRMHRWPGNVRELKNVIERAAIMSADSPLVHAEHLMIQRRTSRPGGPPAIGEIQIPAGGKRLEDVVAEAVALTLKLTGGNQAAAARILGISRPTLAKKMNRPAPFRGASVA
jgi:transcriptional regulator with PAS, ATPase and Fis domain